mmetsp:Transcript_19265/g.72774  ORF Transcript_19265/g.72774 Transcript_19265/m.72774 type:complete len:226 (-) Transcript_19265:99-776(-)
MAVQLGVGSHGIAAAEEHHCGDASSLALLRRGKRMEGSYEVGKTALPQGLCTHACTLLRLRLQIVRLCRSWRFWRLRRTQLCHIGRQNDASSPAALAIARAVPQLWPRRIGAVRERRLRFRFRFRFRRPRSLRSRCATLAPCVFRSLHCNGLDSVLGFQELLQVSGRQCLSASTLTPRGERHDKRCDKRCDAWEETERDRISAPTHRDRALYTPRSKVQGSRSKV